MQKIKIRNKIKMVKAVIIKKEVKNFKKCLINYDDNFNVLKKF